MEEETKNRYFIGTLGALIGALIGAIPWILMYVFGNMMVAILSIIIVICSFYGYKLTKAKIDKKLPIILSITSFISISITTLIIIPLCLLQQEGLGASLENLQYIYTFDEFTSALIQDYIISLVFCIAVIGGIIVNLNKQIKEGVESKDIKLVSGEVSTEQFSNEDIEKVKDIFEKNDALDKNHTITKELVLEDIISEFGEEKGRKIFDYLKIQKIIRKKSNKYYFSTKAQKSTFYRYGISSIKTFVIVMIIAIGIALAIIFGEQKQNNEIESNIIEEGNEIRTNVYELGANDIKLEMTDDLTILTNSEIEYYLGDTYAEVYDCIAVNNDFSKIIMVFTDYKFNYEEGLSAEGYLKMALDNDELEVQKQEINGNTFYIVEQPYEGEDGVNYVELDCIYDAGDRFICMIFDSAAENPIDINDIIK